ncbi:MAG: methylase [Candidatus Zambryskibacteria bacterium RIFOXYD2_FULL_43_10]|uniref:site-specific DNA-methyltransferase (adenine-specific) n=1 Tax=Candidatus Zambryskibacteria bacterium RIFOXYD2_FULL_43_10 TaxID=1802782 RepID=A0A1G2V5F0_9BACT|nr:MAG: methylase [Candidatus Nomurabacteria bacterium RIFCSPHIGHO2_12_40_11]OHB16845.1 MAG: methylase [Candidatus Zambryskibacteria bacterium RIFOXYD2_FULL_43_10]
MISPNEIKNRALAFSLEWALETREDAEAKTFWDDFFEVFGITRRRVASFEHPIKKLDDTQGYADLLWKGVLLVEHKSKGKSLDTAYKQAIDYFPGLKEKELPRYIIVSDFEKFRVYDLDEDKQYGFPTRELSKYIDLFGFISGHENQVDYEVEVAANIQAAELMAEFHNEISKTGYTGPDLEVFLIRVLFCLFADDTGIFPKDVFKNYINNRTDVDGSDLGSKLAQIFQVLNTPEKKRQSNLDDDLAKIPYVNGGIFSRNIGIVSCDVTTKLRLVKCCNFDWSAISAAIFGSLFQGVMNEDARRHLGAHYTSEQNILKLIKSLFLDDLYIELDEVRHNSKRLDTFHTKLGKLKFMDPACGCGNFLVIAYRELRILEMEILKIKLKNSDKIADDPTRINIDQFYGIEIEEFPARIAEVAMHLIDHQMNLELGKILGKYIKELPIKKSATIKNTDALSFDWNDFVSKKELSYILGNPPFLGARLMSDEQKEGIIKAFDDMKGAGNLDFVTAWYAKAAKYIQGTKIKVGFVSTNSISQGEQVGLLWKYLKDFNIVIHFAHQTFKWSNDAPGVAAVYCVIVGFGNFDIERKYLYEYEDIRREDKEREVAHINPYLVEGEDVYIESRRDPTCDVPEIVFGSMPNDGGNFLFTPEEKDSFLESEPGAEPFIKELISAKEYLNGEKRYCLWLKDADPTALKKLSKVIERIENVRKLRSESKRKETKELAKYPSLFGEIRQPESAYVVIPRVSSENRAYIPMGFFGPEYIVGDTCLAVPNATLYHFGVLQSEMHMVWVKYVCGRLKSDYRYSNNIVYNNFPWPEKVSAEKKAVEKCAEDVIFLRTIYPHSSLADLYDPNTMPSDLREAHEKLDRAVEACYGRKFKNDQERISFLFDLYKKLIK